MRTSLARLIGLLLCVTACGNGSRKQDDAGVVEDDAAVIDANEVMNDAAMIDALILPPAEAREIIPGGARMTGATYTIDVQLGHGTAQIKSGGATYSVEGNTAIKP